MTMKLKNVEYDIKKLANELIDKGLDKRKVKHIIYSKLVFMYSGETYDKSHLIELIHLIVDEIYKEIKGTGGKNFSELVSKEGKGRTKAIESMEEDPQEEEKGKEK